MDEAERLARAARFRDEHLQWIQEEKERSARQAAVDECHQCPEPKPVRHETITFSNGVRLLVSAAHCLRPGPNCTALIEAHLTSESPEVANTIVKWLAAQPELKAAGVSWMGCLAPGADRLSLTYRVPAADLVAATITSLPIESFREKKQV